MADAVTHRFIAAHRLTAGRVLVRSENRMTGPDPSLRPAFSQLQILMANRQLYSWEDVLQCAHMWPDVRRLTVSNPRPTPTTASLFFVH